MTIRRFVVCIIAVVAVSIVNIYHHALAVKYGYELGRVQAESARLKRTIAGREGEVATLTSPARLRAENQRMQLALVDPGNLRRAERAVASARLTRDSDSPLVRR